MSLNFELKKEYFNTFLKDDNQNTDATGDYVGDVEEFSYVNQIKKKLFISKLTITIEDNAVFATEKYGRDIVLKKGVKLYYTKDKVKQYIIGDNLPIIKNKDWFLYGCQVEQRDFKQGNKFLQITFDFNKTNNYIILNKGDRITFELCDDFHNLENQVFNIEGFYVKV